MKPRLNSVTTERLLTRNAGYCALFKIAQIAVYALATLSAVALLQHLVHFRPPPPADVWLTAYDQTVAGIVDQIFGWTRVGWFGITHSEGHVIVVSSAFLLTAASVAFGDVHVAPRSDRTPRKTWLIPMLFVLFFWFIIILPLMVLPGLWGTLVTALNLAVLVTATRLKSAY